MIWEGGVTIYGERGRGSLSHAVVILKGSKTGADTDLVNIVTSQGHFPQNMSNIIARLFL